MSAPFAPSPKATPPRTHRRKATAENWDDDFEFAFPSRASSKAAPPSRDKEKSIYSTADGGSPGLLKRRSSPIESWTEGWDDSPPGPSRLSYNARHPSRHPAALNLAQSIFQPPRLSPSQSLPLPSPDTRSVNPPTPWSSSSTTSKPLISASSDSSFQQRPRSGSASATVTRNKLIKRHPSASFVPIQPSVTWSDSPSPSPTPMGMPNRSSPDLQRSHAGRVASSQTLHHSKSSEQMPPPPLPSGLTRSRSRTKSKGQIRHAGQDMEAKLSGLPLSPSMDNMRPAEGKKPGFWKRFSGVPGSRPGSSENNSSEHRRRRSSSVGTRISSDPTHHPPMPPLPPNLRSPSAASSSSANSVSSSLKSGPVSALSSMLRRSSSNLSKRSKDSAKSPPSSYPYAAHTDRSSMTSLGNTPMSPMSVPGSRRDADSPTLPSSASFSRGFHLPSPSPRSPYNLGSTVIPAAQVLGVPALPHSTSFPDTANGLKETRTGSDTETEPEDKERTPRRRKKVRPVSALPAPRMRGAQGWNGDGWKGLGSNAESEGHAPPLPPPVPSSTSIPADLTHKPTGSEVPSPRPSSVASGGLAATTTSTLRRLGSLSKKHGRRLSGGWKFGTNSSSSSTESKRHDPRLEPVMGSPSKPSRSPLPVPHAEEISVDDEFRDSTRAGSMSAPNSMFKSETTRKDKSLPWAKREGGDDSILTTTAAERKEEKQRRRQSWNDLVIPRNVLEKQKELKQGIGAVKMFAGGVESLKSLLETHADMQRRVIQSADQGEIALFSQLEQEFAQYWEMATVLIEVGSTGQRTTSSTHTSPARSRRITLAGEEAKAAGEMLRAASASGDDLFTPRKTSLPDPQGSGGSGPPRASPPEQWRASTGRQDLSKRQLEILRTMLRTPVSDSSRPNIGSRQTSALSTSSTLSELQPNVQGSKATMRLTSRPVLQRVSTENSDTPHSGITLPSPGDSIYVVATPSFPSPATAALSAPQGKRRSSKAGLAGLKDFLRGLRNQRAPSNEKVTSRLVPPASLARNPSATSTATSISTQASPPASPTTASAPKKFKADEVFYPTSRSTFSALGPPSQRKARNPLPSKNEAKRPSIRNIFRTSSGNWTELVRGERREREEGEEGSEPPSRTSFEESRVERARRPSVLGQVTGRGILRSPSQAFSSPKTAPINPSTGWPAATSHPVKKASQPHTDFNLVRQNEGKDERTVRPTRKSRILGLGWPDDALPSRPSTPPSLPKTPSSPTSPVWAGSPSLGSTSPEKTKEGMRFDSPESIQNSSSPYSPMMNRKLGSDAGLGKGIEVSAKEDEEKEGGNGDFRDELVVALTPENLPVLLDYLRQCQGKLGEWRLRVEGLMGD